MEDKEISNPILHVLVVGFHHKKGCQVEYSYPPLIENDPDSNECPPGWKYLPTLALPDGSHNFTHDTVYFHLPSLTHPQKTLFGISCYRQMSLNEVKNRTSDLTRDTVQKAVCVLSIVPLYGHIEVKMSLITQAYFEEGDFTKVSLLRDTYENLNMCLSNMESIISSPQFFVGLSVRDFILTFRHKALLLFKLLLLEKKLIFYCSPVNALCSTILSLLSLHPGMLEHGLYQSACFRPSRPMSPVPQFEHDDELIEESPKVKEKNILIKLKNTDTDFKSNYSPADNFNVLFTRTARSTSEQSNSTNEINIPELLPSVNIIGDHVDSSYETNINYDIIGDVKIETNLSLISQLDLIACGTPLSVFSDGYLCLPYLSLPYMDVLLDPNVRGYVIGATNVLFKQKKQLADVLVEVDTTKIETDDVKLKQQLNLSLEDLRFADFIVKHVCEERQDFGDGVMWEGGDEWIRMQFQIYLFSLLRTSLLPEGSRELEYFNPVFVSAWKDTNSYKKWAYEFGHTVEELNPCHPFSGQLSIADVKLKLSQTLQFSESGKKLNQVVVSTSKVMATTGRAVGGAITQAKGAVSNWFTNLTNVPNNETTINPTANSSPDNVEDVQVI